MQASVVAVCSSSSHSFSKPVVPSIMLVEGVGVEGDAHAGRLVQHTYLVRQDDTQPNLRQVHLMHSELFEHLSAEGHSVHPGDLGENITTAGVDLLGLPTGTRLRMGIGAVVELTGLRNPCWQIDEFQQGLLQHLSYRDDAGGLRRISGVMGVVVTGGPVGAGDPIEIDLPAVPHVPLV